MGIHTVKTFPLSKKQLREYLDAQAPDAVVSDADHLFVRVWNHWHPGQDEPKATGADDGAAEVDGEWLNYKPWQERLYRALPDIDDGKMHDYTRRDVEALWV